MSKGVGVSGDSVADGSAGTGAQKKVEISRNYEEKVEVTSKPVLSQIGTLPRLLVKGHAQWLCLEIEYSLPHHTRLSFFDKDLLEVMLIHSMYFRIANVFVPSITLKPKHLRS